MKKLLLIILLISLISFVHAQYTKLLDFAGTTNGQKPYGDLVSDGTFLYGMTSVGGINNVGTVFKIMPDGSNYTKLFDFAGDTAGGIPYGSLYYDSTFLYGMTRGCGTNNLGPSGGTIFKIKIISTKFTRSNTIDIARQNKFRTLHINLSPIFFHEKNSTI